MMQTIYTLFHGDRNASGLRLFVSPLIKDGLNKIIFAIQSIENGKETALFTAYVDPKSILAVAKVFVMGTFKDFFPEGFSEWGKSSPRATVNRKLLIQGQSETRCLRFRAADEAGFYTLGITIYVPDEENQGSMKRAHKPLVLRLSQQEALEMLVSIETFIAQYQLLPTTSNSTTRPSGTPSASATGEQERTPTATQATKSPERKDEHSEMTQTTNSEKKLAPVASSAASQMDAAVQEASAGWKRTEVKAGDHRSHRMPRRKRYYVVHNSLDLACLFTTDGKIDLRDFHEESLYLVYLDARRHVITTERARTRVLSRFSRRTGRYQSLEVDTRHLFDNMPAHTYWVGFVHNHPGEDVPTPSPDDRVTTLALRKLVERQQVNFLDHVIIGNVGYYSFSDDMAYASYETDEEEEE